MFYDQTPQRAILNKDNVIIKIIGLHDGSTMDMPDGFTIGPKTDDELIVGGSWDGTNYLPPASVPPTHEQLIEMVSVERERRLSLGFDYDFADGRGVHRIGTTASDMAGWRDVIDYANALIDTGDTTTEIVIVTDTGPTSVTAPEWQAVMLQAAVVRQQIWASSFALQSMSPIPGDYDDDAYWT